MCWSSLIRLASTNGDHTSSARSANTTATITRAAAPASPAAPATHRQRENHRALAAPAVRKLAFELGVDLEQVTPSNPNGRVSLEDVKAFAEKAKSTPVPSPTPVGTRFIASEQPQPTISPTCSYQAQDERQPLTGLRKRMAEHMERSWRIIPHATAFGEVDAGAP